MTHRLSYATVQESRRQATYLVRIEDAILALGAIEDIAARMRERLEARGEISAEVVIVQGHSKETLRLFGNPYRYPRCVPPCSTRRSRGVRWSCDNRGPLP